MTHTRATLWALMAALGGLPGCLLPSGGGTDSDADESSSTGEPEPTTMTPTTGPGPTTEDEPDTSSSTSTPAAECGNAIQEDGEQCDNGTDNADDAVCRTDCQLNVCGDGHVLAGEEACDDGNDDQTDACITCVAEDDCRCEAAACGDGFVQADAEVCDDAVNDGSYGSCAADCSAAGPFCGDGVVDADDGEECDDPEDPACLMATCRLATSCLLLHEADPAQASGVATIYPVGPEMPVEVYCDMESDGGGYTFLKVDVDGDLNDLPYTAKKAEFLCGMYGMRLLVPRSQAHLTAAYGVATTENLIPVGGGAKFTGSEYLQIFGIYPVEVGVSCLGQALTPDTCPEWAAKDGEDWWVSDLVANAAEPDPESTCKDCSMIYTWNADATVKTYKTIPGTGGTSLRFFCDIGDKLP